MTFFQLVLGYWQGFFILFDPPIYAWWLSIAAIFLNSSWSLHNVIAWMKIKPFLNRTTSLIFIGTVILVQPYWVVEIYANFTYFHNINKIFLKTRPWEALCRDPWWIATTVFLIYNIKTKYDLTLPQIIKISPRFAVMMGAMVLSIIFIVLDVLSVTSVLKNSLPVGINPFWKLSFVFKCLTDAVVLDDFKTALDRLRAFKISRLGSFAVDNNDSRSRKHEAEVANANTWIERAGSQQDAVQLPVMPSPDGDYIQPGWESIEPDRGPNSNSHSYFGPFNERARVASRDRDSEENHVETVDHADDLETRRGASDAYMLKHQDSWLDTPGSSEKSVEIEDPHADLEYAEMVRQMTNDMASPQTMSFGRHDHKLG